MSSLQARGSDGRRFSYGRDILQLFPRLGQLAANNLVMHGFHPSMRKWAEEAGITQPDLSKAAIALASYINMARTLGMTKEAAWMNSGLSALPVPLIMILFFHVGVAAADTYLNLSLEAMPVGAAPWGADRMGEMAERFGFAAQAGSERKKEERLQDARLAADKLQSPDIKDS